MTDHADFAGVMVDEITKNADRLGLAWKLIPGTIQSDVDPATATRVLVDGDTTVSTFCMSLVGSLAKNQRVMVLFVPPHAAYIIGFVPTPTNPGGTLLGVDAQQVTTSGAGVVTAYFTSNHLISGSALFTGPPFITATPRSTSGGHGTIAEVVTGSITTTSCQIRTWTFQNTTIGLLGGVVVPDVLVSAVVNVIAVGVPT